MQLLHVYQSHLVNAWIHTCDAVTEQNAAGHPECTVRTLQLPQLVLALQHSYVAQRSKCLQLVHA